MCAGVGVYKGTVRFVLVVACIEGCVSDGGGAWEEMGNGLGLVTLHERWCTVYGKTYGVCIVARGVCV